jgi:hypothetical protein
MRITGCSAGYPRKTKGDDGFLPPLYWVILSPFEECLELRSS